MTVHVGRAAVECCGTFLVCLVAILAAAGTQSGDAGRLTAAVAYGAAVAAVMHWSAATGVAFVNPAVTLAAFTTGRVDLVSLCVRSAAQLVGGAAAGMAAMWLLAGQGTAYGAPAGCFVATDPVRTVAVEAVLSMAWTAAVLGSSALALGRTGPVAVGRAVAAGAAAGMPWSGAMMNPARALASAVATLDFSRLWMFVAGPCAGAAVTALLWRLLPGPASKRGVA